MSAMGRAGRYDDAKAQVLRDDLMFGWFADRWPASEIEENRSKIDEALVRLAAIGTVRTLRRDETLYMEGDVAERCYEVLNGCLRKVTFLPDGSRHVSAFLHRGELLGVSPEDQRFNTVEAVTDARVLSFPRPAFSKIVEDNHALASAVNHALSQMVQHTTQRFRMVACFGAVGRVGVFLLDYEKRERQRVGADAETNLKAIHLPMGRPDIADHLGLSVETVCRAMTRLRGEGLIDMADPHHFTISDRCRLADFAMKPDH